MKLHLPSALRRAVIACCAAFPAFLPSTLISASLAVGVCSFSQFASAITLDQEKYEDLNAALGENKEVEFNYPSGSEEDPKFQIATLTQDSKDLDSVVIAAGTKLQLSRSGDKGALKATSIRINGEDSELILKNTGLLTGVTASTFNGSTGRIVADLGAGQADINSLMGSLVNYGIKFEVRSGRISWQAGQIDARFSEIHVVDGGQLWIANMGSAFPNNVYISGTGWTASGDVAKRGALRIESTRTMSGQLALSANAEIIVYETNGEATISGRAWTNGFVLTKVGDGTLKFTNQMGGANAGSGINVEAGTLIFTGNLVGFNEQNCFTVWSGKTLTTEGNAKLTAGNNKIFSHKVDGTFNVNAGLDGYTSLANSGGGHIVIGSTISATGDISITGGKIDFVTGTKFGGDVTGVAVTGGELHLKDDFNYSGTITINGGTVEFGGADQWSEGNINVGKFDILSGTFKLQHQPGYSFTGTNFELAGNATFNMVDMGGSSADAIEFGTLTIKDAATNAAKLAYQWNGGLDFAKLTGKGAVEVSKGTGDQAALTLREVRDFSGSLGRANDSNNWNSFTLRIDSIYGSDITIGTENIDFSFVSEGFVADKSTVTIYGQQTVNGDMTVSGGSTLTEKTSLEVSGSFAAADSTVEVDGDATMGGNFTMNGGEFTATSHQVTGSVILATGTSAAAAGAVYNVTGDAVSEGSFTLLAGEVEITGDHTVGGKFDMTEGTYNSTNLTATGGFRLRDGELTTGTLASGVEVWVTSEGTASIDHITLANETRLRYGDIDTPFIETFKNSLEAKGDLYVYALDANYFSRDRLSKGINLGISTSIDKESLFAMGYTRDQYELYQQDGTWWLRSDASPDIDPDSTDGIWDANWTGQMPKRPIDDSIPVVSGVTTPEIYLTGEGKYSAPTMVGEATWAKFVSTSMPVGGDIFGGVQNTASTTVDVSSWLDVESGQYGVIAGGNNLKKGGQDASFESDTHILLGGGATALMVVGGNLQEGVSGNFEGDTYISLMRGARVLGSVVGGSLFTAEHPGVTDTVTASSHIFIYTPLAASPSSSFAENTNVNLVVGGNFICAGDPGKRTFTGDSSINIRLGGSYGTFGKMIVGGDMVGIGIWVVGNCDNHFITHTGSTHVEITGASGVTFTEAVVGGSFDPHSYSLILGSAAAGAADDPDAEQLPISSVYINSGTFRHMVVGGNATGNFGDTTLRRAGLGKSYVYGDTQVVITGGTYYGHSVTSTQVGTGVSYSIGNIAVVGGSYDSNPITAQGAEVYIYGGTSLTLAGGTYYGHVVGGTVRQAPNADNGCNGITLVEKGTQLTMLGGRMVKGSTGANGAQNIAPRVVGGLLLDMPTSLSLGGIAKSVSLGGADVMIGGSAEVYDVIGGSWTVLMDADVAGGSIAQGDISVSLRDYAVVRGDVYAGGIQGGDTPLTADSTKVEIDAGVTFSKWDGSATIISGGYMKATRDENAGDSGVWTEVQDEFGGAASVVTGTRSLVFRSSESYKNGLSNAWLLNFDDVLLANGASVEVGALVNGDGAPISLHGAGTLSMTADLITPKNGEKRMNNSDIELTEGATLHLLRSTSAKQLTYLKGVMASEDSNIIIDLAGARGNNDTLYVENGINMEGGVLTLNINATSAMNTRGIIRSGTYTPVAKLANTPTVSLDGTQVHVHVNTMENTLLDGRLHTLHVVENMDPNSNFTVGNDCTANLEKWFVGPVTIRQDGTFLNLVGTTVSPSTVNYHARRALTANGLAGARMLDNLYVTLNPEMYDPNGNRAAVLNVLEGMFAKGNLAGADQLMAAAGGAGIPAVGHALANDLERQLRAIRNRTTTMGLSDAYDHADLPQLNFWVNAEGDIRKLRNDGTFSGYRYNSWGGTVGVSAEVSQSSTVGVALTAMYGDLRVNSPDSLTGDMTTAYLSAFWRIGSGAWTHTLVATAGLATTDMSRTVNYGTGSYSTDSDPNGYAAGLMYEIGYSALLNEQGTACIQPVLNVAWQYAHLNGYTENGSDAGLQVNATRHHSLVFGAGVRVQAITGEQIFNNGSILEARAIAKAYTGDRQAEAEVSFKNASRREVMKSFEAGAYGAELGAGLTIPLGDAEALFLDTSFELRSNETNFNATIGYKLSF